MASESGAPAAPAGPPAQQQAEEVSRHGWPAATACRGAQEGRPCPHAAAAHIPAGAATQTQAVGAEFFRRRLQRAAAIPPEQRDPAVHAFVTSVQLMEAADGLLPLTADSQPALPADTLAGQQAEVQAMTIKATAMHSAPNELEWQGRQMDPVTRYCQRRMAMAGGSWEAAYPPSLQPLGGLLLRLLFIRSSLPQLQLSLLPSAAADEARTARSTISRQLQQAQRSTGQQVLTAEQLEAELHQWVNQDANTILGHWALQHLRPQDVPTSVADAAVASCERLLVLQPTSPSALLGAAMGFMAYTTDRRGTGRAARSRVLTQRGFACFMSALRAAEAAHSSFYTVTCAALALPFASGQAVAVSVSDLAALVAAAEQAPAAVKQLKGVLPHSWVAALEADARAAMAVLPVARLHLQGGSDTAGERRAALTAITLEQATEAQHVAVHGARDCTCSGCSRRALGLQRCARCKQAACEWGSFGAQMWEGVGWGCSLNCTERN